MSIIGRLMQYQIVKSKAGYIVQNSKTFSVVAVYPTKAQAESVQKNLNRGSK